MKNIKIITIHSIHNFGSVYQTLGLYKYLKKKGHNVSIIDYRPKYINAGKNRLKTYIGRLLNLNSYFSRKKKYENFISNMQLSETRYRNEGELRKLDNKNTLFIAGGDQLWNDFHPCGNDPAFKLSFVKKGARAAFGTSLGRNNFKKHEIMSIKSDIRNFEFAWVREQSSKESLEVCHVVNSILLMNRSFYLKSLIAPKIEELLAYYSLEDRIVKDMNGFIKAADNEIDFCEINVKMNDFIQSSKCYLDTEIEKLNKVI